MADEHEQIRALQVRVSKLETWAGPGQADALATGLRAVRTDVAVIRRVQGQHTAMLTTLSRDVAGLTGNMAAQQADAAGLKQGVAVLKGDVAGLKQDVAVLKGDVAGLKQDVAVLKADVAGLKSDMADVKAALAEVLRRLPPAAV
jgi:cell division protein FtsB